MSMVTCYFVRLDVACLLSFVWDTIFMINSLKIPVCKIIVNGWGGSLCSAMLLFVSMFETTGGSKWTCTGVGHYMLAPLVVEGSPTGTKALRRALISKSIRVLYRGGRRIVVRL